MLMSINFQYDFKSIKTTIKTTNEETRLTHVGLSFNTFPLNYVDVAAYFLLKSFYKILEFI